MRLTNKGGASIISKKVSNVVNVVKVIISLLLTIIWVQNWSYLNVRSALFSHTFSLLDFPKFSKHFRFSCNFDVHCLLFDFCKTQLSLSLNPQMLSGLAGWFFNESTESSQLSWASKFWKSKEQQERQSQKRKKFQMNITIEIPLRYIFIEDDWIHWMVVS